MTFERTAELHVRLDVEGILDEVVRPMGKFDRRNSMKMKRRKAQVKKKERLARRRAPSADKKAAAPKKASAKRAPASKA